MSAEFRNSDAQILCNIVECANQRYLRESRVNQKSSFNILRVLSAYKDTSQQYSARKQHIYNWIIYITKHYNPQSLKQWINAIHELSQMNTSQSNRQSPHSYLTNAYNLNKTVNEFNQNQSYGEYEELMQHKSQLQFNISRDYVIKKKGKCQQDSQNFHHMPISSKMHYISFEPEHENKQNCNSMNQSHNTYKNNSYKIQNLPTRTPGDQSFIHTLPMSYGSPVNSTITKITQNTKQISQPVDVEEQTEEWINMKARADIFHQINLQMKSFSALLANFQAFESFQQIYKKSKHFSRNMRCKHFFRQLQLNNVVKKSLKQLADTSNKFYENKLMRKAFKIINVLYKLKINNPNRKKLNLTKLKPLNFQFILSILFCPSEKDYQFDHHNDTPKSIRNKSKHFLRVEDCEKMEMISEYFECNLKSSKDQISNIFSLYNKSRLAQAFKSLSKNVRTFNNQIQSIQKIAKKTALKDMMKICLLRLSNKSRIVLMNAKKRKNMKQKCFNSLLELALSKKIYSKRYQYILNCHKENVLKNILNIWINRKQQVRIKKLGVQTRINEAVAILKKLIRIKCLKQILNKYKLTLQKQEHQLATLNKQIMKKVFQCLKNRTKQRKIHLQIKNKNKMMGLKKIFILWKKFAKIGFALQSRAKILKKDALNFIKNQADLIGKQIKLRNLFELIRYEKGLRQLRICYNLDKKQQEIKSFKIQNNLIKNHITIFTKILKNDLFIKKINQQSKLISQKRNKLIYLNQIITKSKFIKIFINRKNQKEALINKKSIIKNVMGQRKIFSTQKNNETNISIIKQNNTYVRCHLTMKKQFFKQFHQIYTFQKNISNIQNLRNRNAINFISKRISQWKTEYLIKKKSQQIVNCLKQNSKKRLINIIKQNYQMLKTKESSALNKYNKKLKFLVLLGLAKCVINTENLAKQLKNNLNKRHKLFFAKKVFHYLSEKRSLRIKYKMFAGIHFIHALKQSNNKSQRFEYEKQEIFKLRKKRFYKKFKRFSTENLEKIVRWKQQQQANKKFAIMKLNFAIFRHILRKKQLYMAYKFQAIQLCKISFRGLLMNKKHDLLAVKQFDSRKRNYERISTQEYSSL